MIVQNKQSLQAHEISFVFHLKICEAETTQNNQETQSKCLGENPAVFKMNHFDLNAKGRSIVVSLQ